MVDSGMLIPILADDDSQKYVTLGSSLCYRGEDERKKETTTLEIESDAVFRFCADSDASIDRSGTVLFEIRRMVNAALRHTRRLLRKAESTFCFRAFGVRVYVTIESAFERKFSSGVLTV